MSTHNAPTAGIDRDELETPADRMMLNNSSHPPLCLNCRKPVDLEGTVSRLLSVQKLLLFQTYAEQLRVSQSPKIPTWWDFCDEDLPFCESCYEAVKQLRQLTRQLDLVQRNIKEIITKFKIQILSSEKQQRSPASSHRHRDFIFRNLAVADFVPEISLSKIKIEPVEAKMTICDNPFKIDHSVTVTQPIADVFSEIVEVLGCEELEDTCSSSIRTDKATDDEHPYELGTHLPNTRQRSTRFLKRQREMRFQNSVPAVKSKCYKKWTEIRNGRTFVGGIELIQMENGQHKCGECQGVLNKRKYFKEHVQFVHLGIKRSYTPRIRKHRVKKKLQIEDKRVVEMEPESENNTNGNPGTDDDAALLLATNPPSDNTFPPATQKWTKRVNGKVFVGGIEMIPLDSGRVKCGASDCGTILNNPKYCVPHVQYIHLGFLRPGMENSMKPKRRRDPFPIVTESDGTFTVRGIPLTQDGRYWRCGQCNHKLKRKANMAVHIRTHLGIKPSWKRELESRKPFVGPLPYGKWLKGRTTTMLDGKKFFEGTEVIRKDSEFACGECSRAYRGLGSLLNHIRARHMAVEKWPTCEICTKRFPSLSILRTHALMHAEERTIICHECGSSFKSKGAMGDHIKRVHEKRRFHHCEHCGKEFYSRKDCNKHRLTHGKGT